MASGSRRETGGRPDGPTGARDASIRWHRSRAGDQVVLAVEAGDVRLAVAMPADASPATVRAALAERDRELRHFLRTRQGGGDR